MTPLTYLEQKRITAIGNGVQLFEASVQTQDRKSIPNLDNDAHRNMTGASRRVMMSIGRWVYENVPQVKGAVNEVADYGASNYQRQFAGTDKVWGKTAQDWLNNHDKICDVRGRPYNMATMRRNVILSFMRDCDCGIVYVDTPSGYPLLQAIPGHRIGGRTNEAAFVLDGDNKGRRIIDGVIVGDYGQPLAYRVYGENKWDYSFIDVPADNMFLNFIPNYIDQVRGVAEISSGLFDWQDVKERRKFELLAAKIMSSIAVIEVNERGEPAPGISAIATPDSGTDASGTATGLVTEMLDGGTIRYMKSNAGNELKTLESNRPSANAQAFEADIVRAAFAGMNWSMDFSLDPSKVGGASLRLVVDKIARRVQFIQDNLISPLMLSIDGWRVAKAIKIGQLPPSPEWWMWSHVGQGRLTADEKYSQDVAVSKIRSGISSPQIEIGKTGEIWENVQDDSIAYEKRLQERCKAEGVDPNRIILLTPNQKSTEEIEASTSQPATANEKP